MGGTSAYAKSYVFLLYSPELRDDEFSKLWLYDFIFCSSLILYHAFNQPVLTTSNTACHHIPSHRTTFWYTSSSIIVFKDMRHVLVGLLCAIFFTGCATHTSDSRPTAVLEALESERRDVASAYILSFKDYPIVAYDEVDKFHDTPLLTKHLMSLEQFRNDTILFNGRLQDILRRQIIAVEGPSFEVNPKFAKIYQTTIASMNMKNQETLACIDDHKVFFNFLVQNQQNFSLDQGRVFFNQPVLGQQYQTALAAVKRCGSLKENIDQDRLQL